MVTAISVNLTIFGTISYSLFKTYTYNTDDFAHVAGTSTIRNIQFSSGIDEMNNVTIVRETDKSIYI